MDKLTLAALEATLRGPEPPVAEMLNADVIQLRARAEQLAKQLDIAEVQDSVAAIGGGGAPGVELPSVALSLPSHFAATLRAGTRPVVGRVERGRCLLDLRTVHPDDDDALVSAVLACM